MIVLHNNNTLFLLLNNSLMVTRFIEITFRLLILTNKSSLTLRMECTNKD